MARFLLLILLAALGLALLGGCSEASSGAGEVPEVRPRVRSVTLDAREAPPPGTLEALHALGATHITLVSFGFQRDLNTPSLRFNPDVRWYSESAEGARALAREAKGLGMGVILKPQLWVGRGAWTADISFDDEAQWVAWEADYRAYLRYVAGLAAEVEADLLVVGTELGGPVRAREAFWRGLIAEVREVYKGRLTYAANWYDDYERVPFWDALDYVGVQAYFPLSTLEDPPLDTLKAAWTRHRAAIERVARRVGRPVLFTEIGYRSVGYAAAEPWRWPSRDEHGVVAPAPGLQARLFQAFFETVWDAPWFAGAIVWKWHPEASAAAPGEAPPRRHRRDLDFTPQSKPAEDVIRTWFRRG